MEPVEQLENNCENSTNKASEDEIRFNKSESTTEQYLNETLEDSGNRPASEINAGIPDKEYFDKLFDWNLIEERLKEPYSLYGHLKQSRNKLKSSVDQNIKSNDDETTVKLRDKQSSAPRSEAQRKRRSKDLLQNRRSTGYLRFEDVENAIKEIEEIGMTIQGNFKNDNENHLSNEDFLRSNANVEGNASTTNVFEEKSYSKSMEDVISNINDTDSDSPVKLRENKSSPFNSASSRKRRSRTLLLNRRSTGYVNAEDVERAKSVEDQPDDKDDEKHFVI